MPDQNVKSSKNFQAKLKELDLTSKELATFIPVSQKTIESVKYGNAPMSKALAWMVDRVEERIYTHNGAKINFDNWINNIVPSSPKETVITQFQTYVRGTLDIMQYLYSQEEIEDLIKYANLCEEKIMNNPL